MKTKAVFNDATSTLSVNYSDFRRNKRHPTLAIKFWYSLKLIITSSVCLICCYGSPFAADINCYQLYDDTSANSPAIVRKYPSGRRPTADTCAAILINGRIENGDYEKVTYYFRKYHPFLHTVYLTSPGGSVEEAIKIGAFVRKNLVTTFAPLAYGDNYAETNRVDGNTKGSLFIIRSLAGQITRQTLCDGSDCFCVSSCFLIWAAGIQRQGTYIGIHRPSTSSTRFANMPPEQAAPLYRLILKQIVEYLETMEMPRRYMERMIDVASNEMYWLTNDEAQGLKEVPSITEWIATTCGRFTEEENRRLLSLVDRGENNAEKQLLVSKINYINNCGGDKIAKARDALTLEFR